MRTDFSRLIARHGYGVALGCAALALVALMAPTALGVACANWANVALLRFYFKGGELAGAYPALCDAQVAGASAPQEWPQAMVAYLRGDIAGAERGFTAALSRQTEEERTLRLDQALSYGPRIARERPASVDFMLEYARRQDLTSPVGYMRLAQFYLDQADIAEDQASQEQLRALLEAAGSTTLQDHQPRINRAMALFHLGEYYSGRDITLAIQAYRAAIAADPQDSSQGYAWMSAMKVVEYSVQRQDWDQVYAMLAYAETLPDRYHRYSYTRLRLAQLNAERHGVDQAIADLEQTIRRDPDFAPTRLYLASLYQAQGRLSEASEQYRAVLRIEPDNQEALQALKTLRSP